MRHRNPSTWRVIALALATLGLALGLALFATTNPVAGADNDDPPYLRLLELLQTNRDVLPPKLPRVELFAMYNSEAPVPPQCYTRTEGKYNPCYVCHQNAIPGRENAMNDGDLQAAYSFSDFGGVNHWRNLFEDRSKRVAAIDDDEIRRWIEQDNYSELAPRLRAANFAGWIPDLKDLPLGAAAFDEYGLAKDGSRWIAFNYKPFPSAFWPTNGSTDDVMIRLPKAFRTTKRGEYSRDVYLTNLAILEINIKGLTAVDSFPIDERIVNRDLDDDGNLRPTKLVKRQTHYVGAADKIAVIPSVYPQDTEFLHTVRYVGIGKQGDIVNSTRIKEVRYMRRWLASDLAQLKMWYEAERIEKDKGELPAYINLGQRGLGTRMGWQIAGFIEDAAGRLRANTFEETMFCMGCHNSIGTTVDKTFSFARKVDGARGWRYIDLKNMPDAPTLGETRGEIATYLERTGGGSEFRDNPEMQARWFHRDGRPNSDAIANAKDVYDLIAPSVERALTLDKAYKAIVEEQSYLFGRDPTSTTPRHVYRSIDSDTAPTLSEDKRFSWDIRLDWRAANAHTAANNAR